jgi:phytoene/squalene synthetase
MTEQQGAFTVPTRLFLSPEHRARLERLVREHEIDLAELVSRIVAEYLDALPEPPPQPPEPAADHSAELRVRRAELARLRGQEQAAAPHAPAWLGTYITELEAEIRRIEGLER